MSSNLDLINSKYSFLNLFPGQLKSKFLIEQGFNKFDLNHSLNSICQHHFSCCNALQRKHSWMPPIGLNIFSIKVCMCTTLGQKSHQNHSKLEDKYIHRSMDSNTVWVYKYLDLQDKVHISNIQHAIFFHIHNQ